MYHNSTYLLLFLLSRYFPGKSGCGNAVCGLDGISREERGKARKETHMSNTTVMENADAKAVQAFVNQFSGKLIRPGDAEYDAARAVWNGMIDRFPAAVARCQRVEDVVACVNFARDSGLALAVRGGGHNVAGHATCDGGLVIDLSPLKDIAVDPIQRTARAGGGVTWGELDAASQAHGLATPGGVFSSTGIAGLTLGGGLGWLRNKFGLSCDNLIGAEVVTADGRRVKTSERENSDLLWGLRGGGGNFGVVTTFEYRLHPVGPEVMFVFVFYDGRGEKMKRAIQFYRDFCATAPDEVSSIGFTGVVPPGAEHYPEAIHNIPFFAIGALYAGVPDVGQEILRPLTHFESPLIDFSGVMPYVQAQTIFDEDYPTGWRYYWKSLNLNRLDDEVIDRIVEHSRRQPSPFSTTDLWHVGGAVRRFPADQSAFFGRQAAFLLNPEANWEHAADDAANLRWVRDFSADMQQFSDGSRYLNFAGFQEEGDSMMRASYGPQHARLVALKNKYDPTNLFRLNQNIQPGG
jgi:FAD/FMN-containing dehydrogenase